MANKAAANKAAATGKAVTPVAQGAKVQTSGGIQQTGDTGAVGAAGTLRGGLSASSLEMRVAALEAHVSALMKQLAHNGIRLPKAKLEEAPIPQTTAV